MLNASLGAHVSFRSGCKHALSGRYALTALSKIASLSSPHDPTFFFAACSTCQDLNVCYLVICQAPIVSVPHQHVGSERAGTWLWKEGPFFHLIFDLSSQTIILSSWNSFPLSSRTWKESPICLRFSGCSFSVCLSSP